LRLPSAQFLDQAFTVLACKNHFQQEIRQDNKGSRKQNCII